MNKWGDSAKSQCSTKRNDRTCFVEWHPYFKRNVLTLNLQSVCKKKKKFVKSLWNHSTIGNFVNTFYSLCVSLRKRLLSLQTRELSTLFSSFSFCFPLFLSSFPYFLSYLSICLCCNLDGYILAVIETSTWGHREGEVLWDLDQFGARN